MLHSWLILDYLLQLLYLLMLLYPVKCHIENIMEQIKHDNF